MQAVATGAPGLAGVGIVTLAVVAGLTLMNDLAFDGPAWWLHVAVGVRGWEDRLGRALASTVAHDAHNLVVVGASDEDMAFAVQRPAEVAGGVVGELREAAHREGVGIGWRRREDVLGDGPARQAVAPAQQRFDAEVDAPLTVAQAKLAALGYRPAGRQSVMELLSAGAMQFVCLGDYFHGEGRVRRRWKRAFDEFSDGFRTHTAMDEEMTESLAVLMMVASLKTTFPARVHLLKGNHEHVTNESGGGNYPFGKYAYEGAMVLDYLQLRYNDEVIARLYEFEKRLPLLAVGERFIITHAEPARFFSREDAKLLLVAGVVYLTWRVIQMIGWIV